MKKPFRQFHLFNILDSLESQSLPLDLFLRNYFRSHPAVGSKDRKMICEAIYGMIRWKGLLDHLCDKPVTWETRYALYTRFDPMKYLHREDIPSHIRVSFPKIFFQLLAHSYGDERAIELCRISNETAPTTLRINSLKSDRETLLRNWEGKYPVSPCSYSEWGIHFHQKINFFEMSEFKEGLFEIQDEGSQLIADLVQAKPGEQILDFCAGSGGKTLAFAPKMANKGQIYLHDIRPYVLQEAKKRLRRAGIQNAQSLFYEDKKKSSLKNRMDWVLVDAPCSGSGTLRRNPDRKWKFDLAMVDRLVEEQRSIVEQALEFLKPSGSIVYATCSIFPEENEKQVIFFKEKFNLTVVGEPFLCFPQSRGSDGFFGVTMKQN